MEISFNLPPHEFSNVLLSSLICALMMCACALVLVYLHVFKRFVIENDDQMNQKEKRIYMYLFCTLKIFGPNMNTSFLSLFVISVPNDFLCV